MKHILATLLTVFCLFTAGLVAQRPIPGPGPGASGEAGGDGGAAACGRGYSSAVGTYTYGGYNLNYYRNVYPGFQLCIDNTTGDLVVINDSGRTERIITQD